MEGYRRFIPLLIVFAIFAVFFKMMGGDRNPKEIKSVLIDKPAPAFSLPALAEGGAAITEADLKTGKPILVNFFASWCVPCRAEHDNLMKLADELNIPIIGIAYKDDPKRSLAFLDELGTPFTKTAQDRDGRVGIDWGVTGVPETFLIDGDGIIRYRHWGPIVGDSMEKRLLPQLRDLE